MANSDAEDDRFESATPPDSGHEQDGDLNDQMPNKDGKKMNATNAKDPNRPRRKKARRACFACQRAHLTCGMLYYYDLRQY